MVMIMAIISHLEHLSPTTVLGQALLGETVSAVLILIRMVKVMSMIPVLGTLKFGNSRPVESFAKSLKTRPKNLKINPAPQPLGYWEKIIIYS